MLHYAYRNASKHLSFSFEKDVTTIGIVLCYKGECICQFWSRPFKEEDEEIGGLGTSSVLFWLMYFANFESLAVYRNTRRASCVLITAVFKRSELLFAKWACWCLPYIESLLTLR